MIMDCSDNPKILNLFRKLYSVKNTQMESNGFLAKAIIYEIISIICKEKEKEYLSSDTKGKLFEVYNFITENFTNPELKISDLTKICGIGEKHLRNQFKKRFGTSPTQYIIDMRLNAATNLLADGNHSVSEVAQSVGFADVYYFSRLFKKRFSVSPKAFKKSPE